MKESSKLGKMNEFIHSAVALSVLFFILTTLQFNSFATEVTRNPSLYALGMDTVTVRWRTDSSAISSIKYGTSLTNLDQSAVDTSSTTDHVLTINGLSPGVKYYYEIWDNSSKLIGGTSDYYFITNEGVNSTKTFRVWIGGDVGQADRTSEFDNMRACNDRYFERYGNYHADAVIWAGDMVENGLDSEYQQSFDIYKHILQNSPVYTVRGNHDSDSGVYYNTFSLPADGRCGGYSSGMNEYYSWELGPAHFIALTQFENSSFYKIDPNTSSDEGRLQYEWLKADLENIDKSKIKWIVVYTHHPFYTRGHHSSYRSARSGSSRPSSRARYLQEDVVPLLEQHGVDLVITGHNHCLERSYLMHGYKEWDNSSDYNFVDPTAFILSKGNNGEFTKDATPNAPGTIYCTMPSCAAPSSYDDDSEPQNNDELVPMMPVIIGKNDPEGHTGDDAVGFGVMEIQNNRLDVVFVNKDGSTMDEFSVTKGDVTPTASAPTATPAGGSYQNSVTVTLSADSGADIFYSLDGSTPTIAYTAPIVIDTLGTTTLKAIAKEDGVNDSTIITEEYVITVPTASAPTATPAGGLYQDSVTVTLSADAGADIFYSLDGSTPTIAYTAPIVIDTLGTTTLKAIAKEDGVNDSNIITEEYVITDESYISISIASENDDAEEGSEGPGTMYLHSSDLELTLDSNEQVVGMRFVDIPIPPGASITNAYIQFTVDETNSSSCNLTITGELSADAPVFTTTAYDISSRTDTSASVSWTPPAWTTVGEAGTDQRTPNISGIIQEIVNQGGWQSGNALVLIINGTGERVAESYDGDASAAPLLHIEYSTSNDTPHSADTNSNWNISQPEVDSFISLYNNNNNTEATANGDITPGRITMREVMRVIYLYNNGGAYQGGQATVDTYDVAGAQGDAEAPAPVADNTITVVNSADSGAGSFRDAIADAAPGDTITFSESLEKITLANEIVIDKSVTIDGNGVTIVSGNSETRIFQIYNKNEDIFVSLLNMGIVDANNSIDEFGGAIYNNGENLTLENCLLNNNANTVAEGKGGAVYTSGVLTVKNCVFSNNTAKTDDNIYSTNGDVIIE